MRASNKKDKHFPKPVMGESQRLVRGLSLLSETDGLLQVCQLSPEFLSFLAVKNLISNREGLPKLIRGMGTADLSNLTDRLSQLNRIPSQLYGMAIARRVWSRHRSEYYINSINLFNFHNNLNLKENLDINILQSIDIVINQTAVVPTSKEISIPITLGAGCVGHYLGIVDYGRGPTG